MALDPFGRFTGLRAQWAELTPAQRRYATREVEALKHTHTFSAAWNVAMTRARAAVPEEASR